MELSQKFEQRQVISQRLQQSLRLLTLNNFEIEAAIEEELEANPVLEWEPGRPAPSGSPVEPASRTENVDWQKYFEIGTSDGFAGEEAEEYDRFAGIPEPPGNLADHLIRQLETWELNRRDYELAATLAYSLDADGYLRVPIAELAEELEVDPPELVRTLEETIQRLDPPGVGGRDLREVLSLQWRLAGEEAPPGAGVIIEEHLSELATKPPAEIAQAAGLTTEEFERAVAYIKTLEPRPGRAFGRELNYALVPDIRVELVEGRVDVKLLDDRIGRLYLSPRYRELAARKDLDPETSRFLRYRFKAATSFIRAIHQRRRTLEKVATAVFNRQKDFFARGAPGLRPLTMAEIADEVGFHVSTVSRAVAGKVVDAPPGIYPLKYFFTGGVAASDGRVAVKSVKALLEDIIDDEDNGAPLSDEELAAELSARGVKVARRTVAKYRNELKIPGKHERRKGI